MFGVKNLTSGSGGFIWANGRVEVLAGAVEVDVVLVGRIEY